MQVSVLWKTSDEFDVRRRRWGKRGTCEREKRELERKKENVFKVQGENHCLSLQRVEGLKPTSNFAVVFI